MFVLTIPVESCLHCEKRHEFQCTAYERGYDGLTADDMPTFLVMRRVAHPDRKEQVITTLFLLCPNKGEQFKQEIGYQQDPRFPVTLGQPILVQEEGEVRQP